MSDTNVVRMNIPADNPLFDPVFDAGHHIQDPFYLAVTLRRFCGPSNDVNAKLVLTHAVSINHGDGETWLTTEWALLP